MDAKTLISRAEQMHGTDRCGWSLVNLRSAKRLGDDKAAVELLRRNK
jgi:hypothetical protein